MKGRELTAYRQISWRKIPISLIDLGTGILSVNACSQQLFA